MADELEPISGDQARAILDAAMRERLGDNWAQNDWVLITGHDYMARVTKGSKNVDFYVDLLGNVKVEEREINSAQESGRLIAWLILLVSLGIAFLLARIAGWV
jgi:hypothetical protein